MAVTHGTSTSITVTGINSLAADGWAESAQVTTPDCHDVMIGGYIEWNSAPADGETVEVYVTVPHDKANPTTTIGGAIEISGTPGLDGTSSTETEGTDFMQENLVLARVIVTSADVEQHFMQPFGLVATLGFLPTHFSLVFHNTSAADTLNSTGGAFMYTSITFD